MDDTQIETDDAAQVEIVEKYLQLVDSLGPDHPETKQLVSDNSSLLAGWAEIVDNIQKNNRKKRFRSLLLMLLMIILYLSNFLVGIIIGHMLTKVGAL